MQAFLQLQQVGAALQLSVWASNCSAFSCCGAWAVGPLGFGSCGSQALEHRLSNFGTQS